MTSLWNLNVRLPRRAVVAVAITICAFSAADQSIAGPVDELFFGAVQDTGKIDDVYRGVDAEGLELGGGSFVAVPVPIVEPTFGLGGALAGLYSFEASAAPDAPRSTLGLVAGYTDTESWLVAGGLQAFLDGDRFRFSVTAGHGNLNLEFFGIGDSPFLADNPIEYTARGSFLGGTGLVRLADDLFAGVSGRYLDAEIRANLPFSFLPSLSVPFTLSGFGPQIEFDNRNGTWWPTDGGRARFELLWYDDAFGSDLSFRTSNADISYYYQFLDDVVLAGNARLATASDSAPFFMKPFVSLRGFPAG